MGKMFNYVLIIFSISAFLYVAGIVDSNITIKLIKQVMDSSNFTNSDFYIRLLVYAIGIIAGGVIVASAFGNANVATTSATIAVVYLLANFVSDVFGVLKLAAANAACSSWASCSDWVFWVIFVISIPFMFGYIMSAYDYIRGLD